MADETPEIVRVSPSLLLWHRYAPEVKVELFSTAIVTASGAFLVDPVAIGPETLRDGLGSTPIAGVLVTNENHLRDAVAVGRQVNAPIHMHADAQKASNFEAVAELRDGSQVAPGLTAIAIEGAAAGEMALYSDADNGSLIIGDALINMGSYGFTFLPAKYCSNQKRMRKSLARLLEYDFTRILFAHGLPVVSDAKSQLAQLFRPGHDSRAGG